jgi:hypothetical protein
MIQASQARTLAEIRASVSSVFAFHAKVRGLARAVYMGPKVCAACGYSLHVDVCHIRPVRDFPMDTPLSVVNAADNLVALDKRCHWEMDHGHLTIGSAAQSRAGV